MCYIFEARVTVQGVSELLRPVYLVNSNILRETTLTVTQNLVDGKWSFQYNQEELLSRYKECQIRACLKIHSRHLHVPLRGTP